MTVKRRISDALIVTALLVTALVVASPAATGWAQTVGCPVGTMSYWNFDDENEPAKDYMGSHDGTVIGAVTTLGLAGGALRFDGLDDRVMIGDMGAFPAEGSLEFWINPEAVENYRNPFSSNYAGDNTGIRFETHQYLGPFTNGLEVVFANDAGIYNNHRYAADQSPYTPLQPNTWYQVVLTWSVAAGNAKGYLNGIKTFDEPQTYWPTRLPIVAIGTGYSTSGERQWKGLIDEVAIYSRELSEVEVEQHRQRVLGGQGYCGPRDIDRDGVPDEDEADVCQNTPSTETRQIVTDPSSPWYGCGPSQRDTDGDGLADARDACQASDPSEISFIANSLEHLGCGPSEVCVSVSCDPAREDDDKDGFVDQADLCPWTDSARQPYESIIDGCACYQILQLKPGDNQGEMKKGCNPKTKIQFRDRTGWAKNLPRPPH